MLATKWPGWSSRSKVLVTSRANPAVFSCLFCNRIAIDSFMSITKLTCLLLPDLGMAGILPAQSMGYLMQQHLFNLIECCRCHEVLGEANSLVAIVAKACSSHSPVEPKGIVDNTVLLKKLRS